MTPEEIKNLIDQKIAGQGTMVDAGGALTTILKEIVELIPSSSNALSFLTVNLNRFDEIYGKTYAEAAERLGITSDQLLSMLRGDYPLIKDNNGQTYLALLQDRGEGDNTYYLVICYIGFDASLSPHISAWEENNMIYFSEI